MALGKQKLSSGSWNSIQAHIISCRKLNHFIKKTTHNYKNKLDYDNFNYTQNSKYHCVVYI